MAVLRFCVGRSAGIATTRNWALLAGLFFVLLAGQAKADPCPGSDTCPSNQSAIAQGPNAVEVKWTEPNLDDSQLPIAYSVTSKPAAPNQPWWFGTVAPDDWEDR